MKRLFLLMGMLCALHLCKAQEEKVSTLNSVTIEASRVIHRDDGLLLIPSEKERNASPNGYSLLAKLGLPDIRIDEVQHSITSLSNRGEVQVRINGTLASREDLLALDPSLVRSIAFVDNPGLRYGSGIGYVLDIRTRRASDGYTLGADVGSALTTRLSNDAVFGRINRGRSELGLTYNLGYSDFKGKRYDEVADYTFTDGSLHTIERHDKATRTRNFTHNAELRYSLADSASFVFQATLAGSLDRTPLSFRRFSVSEEEEPQLCEQRTHEEGRSPSLDLYFYHQLRKGQSVTANVVATYIGTTADHSNDEGGIYIYKVRGKSRSLFSEVLYEKTLKPVTLNIGFQQRTKDTHNTYSGDVSSHSDMLAHNEYLYAEAKGRWQGLSFTGGVGMSNDAYRQGSHRYHFWLVRPKLTARYAWSEGWSVGYSFEQDSHVSQIAMVTDTRIRQNRLEWIEGNPSLRPNRVTRHNIRLAYSQPRLTNSLLLHYRHNAHPNMACFTRTDDDLFVYSQTNQRRIDMWFAQDNCRLDVVPNHLSAQLSAGIYRFRNQGNEYDHRLTTCNVSGSIEAYLGKWTLTANADNGWHFMEGETRSRQGAAFWLTCSWQWRDWTFSAFWQHPFQNNPKLAEGELKNRFLHKSTNIRCEDYGNMVSIRAAWKFRRGREFRELEKRIATKKDTQSGILSAQ